MRHDPEPLLVFPPMRIEPNGGLGALVRVKISRPPDYSTPEAVSERCWEVAWGGGCPHSHTACEWSKHVKMLKTMRASLKGRP